MGDQPKDSISGETIDSAAGLIIEARRIVVFTGAGISTGAEIPKLTTESGVAVSATEAHSFPQFVGDPAERKRSWQLWSMFRMIDDTQPNATHGAVAEIYRMDKLDCVITQNVDGLHQKSGIPDDKVIELHGSIRWLKCLSCGKRYSMLDIAKRLAEGQDEESTCSDCGGKLKSATVSFGEPPLSEEISQAEKHSRNCDLFMLLGSSLMVYPAAYMPIYAVESGAKLMIINTGTSNIDDKADIFLKTEINNILPIIINRVKEKIGN
ncbi:MAG: Sir2 family NAD-dependent protein deacetylase [Chloroflexota bacterium]|nr:Sir2 family NAD-dependent protein deacetylase [Chloroflexota bacterium]